MPTCPPITDDLIGCRIRYRFDDGIDWMEGEICELDEDGADNEPPWDEVLDCEANYLVYYEADDSDVPHCLDAEQYNTSLDAPFGSWYLVEEEEEGEG